MGEKNTAQLARPKSQQALRNRQKSIINRQPRSFPIIFREIHDVWMRTEDASNSTCDWASGKKSDYHWHQSRYAAALNTREQVMTVTRLSVRKSRMQGNTASTWLSPKPTLSLILFSFKTNSNELLEICTQSMESQDIFSLIKFKDQSKRRYFPPANDLPTYCAKT